MTQWNLGELLAGLHEEIQNRLRISRKTFAHGTTMGDASEGVWLEMLQKYLPQRYQAASAFVVDSHGNFSDQIDIVVFDRQYSPFIFNFQGKTIVPAESVYGAFEAKQAINKTQVDYAQAKVATVRRLHRTSLPIPHAGGTFPPKALIPILGGLLTFESDWNPPLGEPLEQVLSAANDEDRLNLGCVAAHGHFAFDNGTRKYQFTGEGRPATAFLFNLISLLQFSGTVPMIDVQAYAKWLAK
jgi:hypothetical protein